MDVGIYLFWRLKLNDEVYLWDIKSSCGNIGRNKTFKLAFLEALEGYFSLLLWDVSMQHLSLLLEVSLQQDLISFLLSLAEDNGAAMATTVKIDDISDDRIAVIVRAVEGEMFYGFRGTYLWVLDEVNKLSIRGEISPGEFDYPGGDGCRE